ncbi:MAG: SCO family protein [Pseudomonadota bacterium]
MNLRLLGIIVGAFALGAIGAVGLHMANGGATPRVKTSGEALIGGQFTMVRDDGATVTQADFKGKPLLIFFGFTFCPDVCPATLQVTSEALELLGPQADDLNAVFVSVDPERDTPEALTSYLADFDERITGLTGTKEQVAEIAKAWRVYYARVADPNSAGGYTMDHSAYLYLMGPDGRYIRHFRPAVRADELAAGIKPALGTS